MGKAKLISNLAVILLLVATTIATVCLWLFVDREHHGWGLSLTLHILWGCWIVALLATFLTRVAIFGWSFRRYFRWQSEGPPPQEAPRPTRAPWTKGSKTSFSITVVLVSLTGATALAVVVLWILLAAEVISPETFRLVGKILGIGYWVGCIAIVLTRIIIFGSQRRKAVEQDKDRIPPPGNPETVKHSH
jgi:hypothetical protein